MGGTTHAERIDDGGEEHIVISLVSGHRIQGYGLKYFSRAISLTADRVAPRFVSTLQFEKRMYDRLEQRTPCMQHAPYITVASEHDELIIGTCRQ